jgi:arabinose-5-phosphate isomerase
MNARIQQTEMPQAEADLAVARRVLQLEAAGLAALSAVLDGTFSSVVDILIGTKGRVVVSGMGKSGHIARKIAATLASTGTPSHYVHPAEASHGDLGMITRIDSVVALSNSGETPELLDLIEYTRRYSIPLIGLTGIKGSSLERAADATLVIPNSEEACSRTFAPTTSTTVMLALGDAISIALLERRGFSADEFRDRHPGGTLGRRLIRAGDIMHSGDSMPLVDRSAPMAEALIVMSSKSLGCAGVVDESGRLIGIITDGDLRRHMGDGLLARSAGEVMTPSPRSIDRATLAAEALGIMNDRSITSLFVVEDDAPVGVLHIHDCLRAGLG